MAGFDQAGVHGANGDLIHPRSLNGDKRESTNAIELGCGRGVAAHGIPLLGPVGMPHQSAHLGMADGPDPVQVRHFALEPPRRKRQIRQRMHRRISPGHNTFELNAAIRPTGKKQVDDTEGSVVVVSGHQA